MSDRQKVLAAADRLQTFTIDGLASFAGVSSANVRKVVRVRDNKKYFDQTETRRGKRGRPVMQLRVRPDQIEALAQAVALFQQDVNELRAGLRAAQEPTTENVTADLLAAESYILDQFLAAESEQRKAEVLREAIQHLDNDRQLAPALAESPRRKVANALLNLCINELAAQKSPGRGVRGYAGLTGLYQELKIDRIHLDIWPELQNLTPEHREEVSARLANSSLQASINVEPPVSLVTLVHQEGQIRIRDPESPCIEFRTANRDDVVLNDVAKWLRSKIEQAGLQWEIRKGGDPEATTGERPSMLILGCNSSGPANLLPKFHNPERLRSSSAIAYVIDVGFQREFRDRVLCSGYQYVSHIDSIDIESLIGVMQPLPEMINHNMTLRNIMDRSKTRGQECSVKYLRSDAG